MRQPVSAAVPEWPPHHTLPPIGPRERRDAVLRAAGADAALDICLLLHNCPIAEPAEIFQLALRGFCTLPGQVSCATLSPGRLDMRIDGTPIMLAQMTLADEQSFFRPDLAGAARITARLGYFLAQHDMALHLRIGATASPDLIAACQHLLLRLTRPKAVIMLPQRLVFSLSEFEHQPRDIPGQTCLATPLQIRIPQRTRRGRRTAGTAPPIPLGQPAPPPSLFRRPEDRPVATSAPDPVETLLAEFDDTRVSRALRAEFRAAPNWKWVATPGAKQRVGLFQTDAAGSPRARDMLICDAVMLARRGQMRHLLAPILLATLVALMPLAWQDRYMQGTADHDSQALTTAHVYSA